MNALRGVISAQSCLDCLSFSGSVYLSKREMMLSFMFHCHQHCPILVGATRHFGATSVPPDIVLYDDILHFLLPNRNGMAKQSGLVAEELVQ